MYSFIGLFPKNEKIEDKYYQLELERIGPLDKQFTIDYFNKLIKEDTKKISLKAFLATEQRILGIGNGVVQDILFNAELNPKRKVTTLNNSEIETLYHSIKQTLIKMIDKNGRDTEKDIYGNNGEYHTVMSNKNYKNGCPKCTGPIKKEAFLGGSIYYCPKCQK